MKQVKLLFIITLLCTTFMQSWAVNLATWTFTNASGDWGASPKAAASSNTNLTVGGLTRGSGVGTATGTAAGAAWGGNAFTDGIAAASQTATTAITQSNFITFTVTANDGFSLSMSDIAAYNIRRSLTGPTSMIWQYSLNGTDFTDIGSTITLGSTTSATGNPTPAVALSGITALQNVPSGTVITFRAVMWGAAGDTGTWYLNGNAGGTFGVNGDVSSTPLSLNLVSFKGTSEDKVNKLSWITANEKDVASFEIERGTDGRNFNKIAISKAKGNDNTSDNAYSYNDEQASATAYYRLRMVDRNGNANYSNVVVLHKDGTKPAIHIYPNPASGALYVEGLAKASSYSITDALGRTVVIATEIDGENKVVSIDINNLVQGVYFLQLKDENGNQTIRFIKK